ncbi:hypothetical protein [Nocardioides sp. AE5]|uniref:hypothetical protein n=1 Tax=Nocardioides sp. AE5 TaxID=2962573 RepID=UPI002880E0E4|nr:hypothetical protein [Nocardioides sp. AE5]MDT0203315.1 hypothetical protein [Nocardioides sp. AE5]
MSPSTVLPPPGLEITPRRWLRWLWIPVVFAVLAVGLWWLGHPQDLATQDRTASAQATVGRTVYLGVTDTSQAGRTVRVTEVTVPEAKGGTASVKALICVDGSIAQTTDATRFCSALVDAADRDLRIGTDQLILSITAQDAATIELDRVRVAFRDGLQRGESAAGPTFAVTFLG